MSDKRLLLSFLFLAVTAGCASIGVSDEGPGERVGQPERVTEGATADETPDGLIPVGEEDGTSQDASGASPAGADASGTEGDSPGEGAGSETGSEGGQGTGDGSDPAALPPLGGGDAGEAGDGTGAGVPVTPSGQGSCAMPYELVLPETGGVTITATGDTTGAGDALDSNGLCYPGLSPSILFGAPPPGGEHVYRVTMPFRGQLDVALDIAGTRDPFIFVLTSCGQPATMLNTSCGSVSLPSSELGVIEAGTELYLYVDGGPGGPPPFSSLLQTEGPYTLNVSAVPLVGEGEDCTGAPDAVRCERALFCKDEEGSLVCRAPVCGNGTVEGSEPCDGGDYCDENCRVTGCPGVDAIGLQFVQEGASLVARVSGDTTGAANQVTSSSSSDNCSSTNGGDAVYLAQLETPKRVDISLKPGSGFDAVFHTYRDACDGMTIDCVDSPAAGGEETLSKNLGAMAVPGVFFIVVDGYLGAEGPYDLTVTLSDP